MGSRRPAVAGYFYPSSARDCTELIAQLAPRFDPPAEPARPVAGIVPHAGWVYSGATALKTLQAIAQKRKPETVVIFGAVHSWYGRKSSVYARGAWDTPFGPVEIDEPLARRILEAAAELAEEEPGAHSREHSIEVEVPLIKHLFPQAKIVPIMVPPAENAHQLGERAGKVVAAEQREIVFLGSTDLTHYGPRYGFTPVGIGPKALEWAKKQNDHRLISLALEMKASEVVPEASNSISACGPGALAATVAAARELGAQRGILLEHTTSCEVRPERSIEDFVGYAAILY